MTEEQRLQKFNLLLSLLKRAIELQNKYAEQLNAQDQGERPIYRTFRDLMVEVIRERRIVE